MTDDSRAESDTCPTCGKPAHPKHFLGACGPVSTWPNRAAPRKESVVSDDPREILKAAGVECAEVDRYYAVAVDDAPLVPHETRTDIQEDAILALARLVAKYKWLAEHDLAVVMPEDVFEGPDSDGGFAVERRTGFVLTRPQRRWNARQP